MFKGKVKVWIFVLVLALIVNFRTIIWTNVSAFFINLGDKINYEAYEIPMRVDMRENDVTLKNSFSNLGTLSFHNQNGQAYASFSIVESIGNPNNIDVIIERANDGVYDGYTKYEKALYTPIVYYATTSNIDSSLLMNKVQTSSGSAYQKDLEEIFEGLLEESQWKDIGEKNLRGNIQVLIPSEKSPYYEDVCNFILANIYDTPTTEENERERRVKLNSILEKCEKVESVSSILDNANNLSGKILIAPEFYSMHMSSAIKPVYTSRETIIYYDIFIREFKENVPKKENPKETYELDCSKSLYETIINNSNFFSHVGLRVKDRTYSFRNAKSSSNLLETINIVN